MKYITAFVMLLVLNGSVLGQSKNNDSDKVFIIKRLYLKRQAKAQLKAQKFETYRVSGIGIGHAATQDTRMASPIYKGASVGLSLGWREYSELWYNELTIEAAYSNPSFETGGSGTYNHIRIFSNYALMRKIKPNSSIYVGGSINLIDGLRIYPYIGNSQFNNDLVVSINPEIKFQKPKMIFGRLYTLHSGITVNGFSYVNRTPSYSISLDGANQYWAPIGQFNRARITTGFNKSMRFEESNRFGIEYSWDFYSLNENKGYVKLRSAQHLISLNYWFKTR